MIKVHYPTIKIPRNLYVHAVEDDCSCACGFNYSWYYNTPKKVYKNIKFRNVIAITCPQCIEKIQNKIKETEAVYA